MTNHVSSIDRKSDHIALTDKAQSHSFFHDQRFYYEPMLGTHQQENDLCVEFLGKRLEFPCWISSMTGGTEQALQINQNLARLAGEFGLGMGLGSCRPLLDSTKRLEEFDLRDIIGDSLPFYANLGICQLDEILQENNENKLTDMLELLRVDGLIIHVNPLQEYFQAEGDSLKRTPFDIIEELTSRLKINLIVKEVGQGMGPASLKKLLELPIKAIELAAYGGTNFSLIEQQRKNADSLNPLSFVGHTNDEMVSYLHPLIKELKSDCAFIISGGIRNSLDGYYYNQLLPHTIYAQASSFLKHARGSYDELKTYFLTEKSNYQMASSFLKVKNPYEWEKKS